MKRFHIVIDFILSIRCFFLLLAHCVFIRYAIYLHSLWTYYCVKCSLWTETNDDDFSEEFHEFTGLDDTRLTRPYSHKPSYKFGTTPFSVSKNQTIQLRLIFFLANLFKFYFFHSKAYGLNIGQIFQGNAQLYVNVRNSYFYKLI